MSVTEYQYWPKNKPIPEGWVATMGLHETHHGRYSILIKREVKNADQA